MGAHEEGGAHGPHPVQYLGHHRIPLPRPLRSQAPADPVSDAAPAGNKLVPFSERWTVSVEMFDPKAII